MWRTLALRLGLRLVLVYLFLEAFKMQNFSCIRLITLPLLRWKGPYVWQPVSVCRITFRHMESKKSQNLEECGGSAAGEQKWEDGWEVILILIEELIIMVQTNFDFSRLKPHIREIQLKVSVIQWTLVHSGFKTRDHTGLNWKNETQKKPPNAAMSAVSGQAWCMPQCIHVSGQWS